MSIGWNGTPAISPDPLGGSALLLVTAGLALLAAEAKGAITRAAEGEPTAAGALPGHEVGVLLSSPLGSYVLLQSSCFPYASQPLPVALPQRDLRWRFLAISM